MRDLQVKVSFIVPVYNAANFLDQCINSILNQSLTEIEVICVNDGSTDDSLNMLEYYADKDERIKVFNTKNLGAGNARNVGMANAKGEYIAFVDSDDWIEPEMAEKLYDNAKSNDSDVVLFNSIERKLNNVIKERKYFNDPIAPDPNNFSFNYTFKRKLVMNHFFVIWSKLYKKSFLEQHNLLFPKFQIFNDVKFHILSVALAKKISYLPEILYNYRRMEQISLQNTKGSLKSSFILFDVYKDVENELNNYDLMDSLKIEFLTFKINQSKVRLNIINRSLRNDFFDKIKEEFNKINLSTEEMTNLHYSTVKFYMNVLNSNTYENFLGNNIKKQNFKNLNTNEEIMLEQLNLKNKLILDLKEKTNRIKYFDNNGYNHIDNEILDKLNRDFVNCNFENINAYKIIKKLNLFDEKFYRTEYGYSEELDPLLHYLYMGYDEKKEPNPEFDSLFYINLYSDLKNIKISPLAYFVLYGQHNGKFRINKKYSQIRHVDKFELEPKIKNLKKWCLNEEKRDKELIVSLTSYPKRMEDIHFCIYSILDQELKPDKIILWLSFEEFPNGEKDIPKNVIDLKENGLEIRWCDNIKSFKKLIPALKEYKNSLICTADDDLYYPKNWLKILYEEHIKYPDCIVAHRAKKTLIANRNILEYSKWQLCLEEQKPSFLNSFTTGGGCIFNISLLSSEVFNENIFKELCFNGDDIWFWAMSVLNKTKTRVVKNNISYLTYINPTRELNMFDEKTLWYSNAKHGNDIQLNNVLNHYPKIKEILLSETKGD